MSPARDCENPASFHVPPLRPVRRQWRSVKRVAGSVLARKERVVNSTVRIVLIVILILLLLGLLPVWPYSTNFGYYPVGGVGLIVVILVVLLLAGKI